MGKLRRRALLVMLGALGSPIMLAGPAAAHVELSAASPEEDETVTEALSEIRLEFSGPLQAGGDHAVGLFDPAGERVDDGETVEDSDRVLTIDVGPLEAVGEYTVQHLIIAADGHSYEGSYTFTYDGALAEPPSPEPEPPPAATPEETEAAGVEETAATLDASPAEPTEESVDDADQAAAIEDTGGLPLPVLIGIMAAVGIGAGLLVARSRGGGEGGSEA